MGFAKDKFKQFGIDMDKKTFDPSKFVPTEQEIKEDRIKYLELECERLNKYYFKDLKLIKIPTEKEIAKTKKVYENLTAIRNELEEVKKL